MKPEKLVFRGINSYSEECGIDFSAFHPYGLFGIFGPTGAGKSTIFDAILLALYDEVPRAKGGKGGAGNSLSKDAEVTFLFSVGGERWRVYRRYKVEDGFTLHAHKASLECLTGANVETVAQGSRNVTDAVKKLLALDEVKDFCTAVLLPQGEFSRFLKSTGKYRGKMLQRIFGLSRLGEDLQKKAGSYRTHLEKKLSGVEGEINGLAYASEEGLEALRAEKERLEAALEKTAAGIETLRREKDELEKFAGEFARLRGEAEARRKAREKSLSELKKAKLELSRAEEELRKAAETLEGIEKKRKELEPLADSHPRLAQIGERLDALERDIGEAEREAGKYAKREEKILREAAALLSDLSIEGDPSRVAELLDEVLQKERAALEEAREARERFLRLRSAAALAAGLREGEPCPVCGSVEHPSPAAPPDGEEAALDERIERAKSRVAQLEGRRGEAKRLDEGLVEVRARLAEKKEAVGKLRADLSRLMDDLKNEGFPSAEDFRERLARAKEAREEYAGLEADLEKAKKSLDERTVRRNDLHAALKSLEGTLKERERELAGTEEKLRAASERLAFAAGEAPDASLARLKKELAARESRRDELREKLGAVGKSLEKTETDLKRKLELTGKKDELSAAIERVKQIALLLSRDGGLAAYALALHMEGMLADASTELSRLTRGHYRLALAGGGENSAFELVDDWNGGARRPVESFSGGETFLASFALALALSRSIQIRKGARIDCLFIDEGFGSLDPASLDLVFDALERKKGEKLIGIISHVPELKERVPASIEVIPAAPGASSKVKMRLG